MNNIANHEGGCLCGKVRYKTEGDPKYVGICHCRYCQLRTGSAFGISVYFDNGQVNVLQGDASLKSFKYPTESGRQSHLQFCSDCGTTLLWSSQWRSSMTGVGGGTFDPPTFWYKLNGKYFVDPKQNLLIQMLMINLILARFTRL